MDLFAAIDLRDGRCVRLAQGDFGRETVYGNDPVHRALAFEAAGAQWLHVVDLDAARTGKAGNRAVVADIAAAVKIPVQAGGGVRSEADAEELFGAGVDARDRRHRARCASRVSWPAWPGAGRAGWRRASTTSTGKCG